MHRYRWLDYTVFSRTKWLEWSRCYRLPDGDSGVKCWFPAPDIFMRTLKAMSNASRAMESWMAHQMAMRRTLDEAAAPAPLPPMLSREVVDFVGQSVRYHAGLGNTPQRLNARYEQLRILLGLMVHCRTEAQRTHGGRRRASVGELLVGQYDEELVALAEAALQDPDASAVRMVEIGVYQGATSVFLLRQVPTLHLVGVDPFYALDAVPEGYQERLTPVPSSEVVESTLRHFAEFGDRARLIVSESRPAAEILQQEVGPESFDLVFIDGDHSYQGAADDLRLFEPLIRRGGFVTGHDFAMDSVRKALLEVSPGDLHLGVDDLWWFVRH
mmetsp:Transcript_37867/g.84765  ORF Transcript_37867/g.84765 Transcript_37867/m.84765 type:complete len:328 (-) Transcript_37867:188-1171(-)